MKNILLLLLFSSCISATKVTKDKYKRFKIETKNLSVKSTKTIGWKMFDEKKTTFHMGFQVHLNLPVISQSDLKDLYREKGMDSYLVRIIMQSRRYSATLGYLEVPLFRYTRTLRSKDITGKKYQKVNKTYFQINYRAASLVPRTVNFVCPPLKHRYLIDEILVKDFSAKADEFFVVEPLHQEKLRLSPQKFLASAVVFKGQPSLVGTYSFEVALYDSIKKNKLSNWVRVPEYVEILKENEKNILQCENAPAGGELYDSGKFKWKRKSFWD